MKPAEHFIDLAKSDFVMRIPSATARRTFLYLLRSGLFSYQPGYRLDRRSFDSFLVMLVLSGSMDLDLPAGHLRAVADQFVLVDCYSRHCYGTDTETDVLWMHFDGITARPYYDLITAKLGNVITLRNPSYARTQLREIHDMATDQGGYSEPEMARHITDLLTEFAVENKPGVTAKRSHTIDDSIAYIADNLNQSLTVSSLAERAYMSEYHFIRIFKKQTGLTPHAYITASRIDVAKFLLANSDLSLDEIRKQCGFSSISILCTTFKHQVGMTPIQYRRQSGDY